MIWRHRAHPGRGLKLAYCQNLHAGDDLDETLARMRAITLPLRARLGGSELFGVGLYLSARLARRLASQDGARDLERCRGFLADHALDPFTINAFPHGRFHEPGLKRGVFEPSWKAPERLAFTLDAARVAVALGARGPRSGEHVSVSTHTGMFGARVEGPRDLDECAENLGRAVLGLARLEEETGVRVVLALEPEPRANAGDTTELKRFLARAAGIAADVVAAEGGHERERAASLVERHLGACLDCCHAAVEFEHDPLDTLRGIALGKLQYSNALSVVRPATNPAGVAALLALEEPVYLHQVTGRGAERLAVDDLPDLRAALASLAGARWLALDEWRCHLHVPVDLESAGSGLATTRGVADELLARLVAAPETWTTRDLHVEIETYTWDVLPGAVRGPGSLVDGLEREYRHVIGILGRAGWEHA